MLVATRAPNPVKKKKNSCVSRGGGSTPPWDVTRAPLLDHRSANAYHLACLFYCPVSYIPCVLFCSPSSVVCMYDGIYLLRVCAASESGIDLLPRYRRAQDFLERLVFRM